MGELAKFSTKGMGKGVSREGDWGEMTWREGVLRAQREAGTGKGEGGEEISDH